MRLKNSWKDFRLKSGLTQRELGELIGRSKQMISKIERGDATTTMDVVARACQVFNCKVADLYPDDQQGKSSFF